jgi:protein phosphatase
MTLGPTRKYTGRDPSHPTSSFVGTDRGRVRPNNEDSAVNRPDLGLLAVADGVGGHLAGETASSLAVNILEACISFALLNPDITVERCTEVMRVAFHTAGRGIIDKANSSPQFDGMGTTLVAVLRHPVGRLGVVGHVGDSRCYRARSDILERITVDHTLAEELIAQGRAQQLGDRIQQTRNILTRALGIKRPYEVDIIRVDLEPGDRFLLASDGLTDVVSDPEIAHVLCDQARSEEQVVTELIHLALDRGGPDNVTVGVTTILY